LSIIRSMCAESSAAVMERREF